jgi:hypothetical protein
MMSLDASKRDVCRVRRERTSSPLQALVLLNGPQFVEAARVLGQRLINKRGDDVDGILETMFRMTTSRPPSGAEREVLITLYRQQLAYFQNHVDRAQQYLETGDARLDSGIPAPQLAATSAVAVALLAFDECVTKR